ncbi:hypothetical protein QO010_001816 [Caulobacter ginsengisoli]|uniref:Polyketide cyclase n=1 Tax=Caulobacter ginsengisoli TaxID=400775 RepID=A0ABU0IPW6_9CAUL|nr:SRPBCC family protein [Caulobacter ginsengisoli]MDQ0464045.1 hypothetical protein [Caulobacter ginsengisoli]
MTRHQEARVRVSAPPRAVFERLDDQTHLAEHMTKPSMMMGGGAMTYDFDEARGQAVGSHIRMGGEAFGLSLFVDEVVTERDPSRRKVWRTVGTPRLLVVGPYEMGFELTPAGEGSDLRVWIDYDLPERGLGRWLGAFPAGLYARWCVQRMAADAVENFSAAA